MVIHDILLPQSIANIDELFAGLSAALRSCGAGLVEGYSYQIHKQITRISELIVSRRPSSILEIGFNGGHSMLDKQCDGKNRVKNHTVTDHNPAPFCPARGLIRQTVFR